MWRLLGANGPKLRDFESNRDKVRTMACGGPGVMA
jgi:hypothetical protein